MKQRFRHTSVPSALQRDITDMDEAYCYVTGSTVNLDFHHIFNGPYKFKSEQDGYYVFLRHDVHMRLHETQAGRQFWTTLKRRCQEHFERTHTREQFIKRYGRNYL